MNLGTYLYTWLCGYLVGEDEFGNKYFSNLKDFNDIKAKRWVMYSGEIEASTIPPLWHAWLHRSIDVPPIKSQPSSKPAFATPTIQVPF